jgi:hypothetical protein
MKHLKRFNESAFEADGKFTSLGKIREFENELNNTLFTPKTEKVSLKSLYKAIVIKTQYPISTEFTSHAKGAETFKKVYDANWILLSFRFDKFGISFYSDENAINSWLRSGYLGDFRDYLMLDHNDINHAEIENILSDYGVVVDEMWGIPL